MTANDPRLTGIDHSRPGCPDVECPDPTAPLDAKDLHGVDVHEDCFTALYPEEAHLLADVDRQVGTPFRVLDAEGREVGGHHDWQTASAHAQEVGGVWEGRNAETALVNTGDLSSTTEDSHADVTAPTGGGFTPEEHETLAREHQEASQAMTDLDRQAHVMTVDPTWASRMRRANERRDALAAIHEAIVGSTVHSDDDPETTARKVLEHLESRGLEVVPRPW